MRGNSNFFCAYIHRRAAHERCMERASQIGNILTVTERCSQRLIKTKSNQEHCTANSSMPPWRRDCWGLGLRKSTRRLISAFKTSPNLSAGPRWLGDNCARRFIGTFQKPARRRGHHLREAEGDSWSLRSTGLEIRTFGTKGIACGNEGDS